MKTDGNRVSELIGHECCVRLAFPEHVDMSPLINRALQLEVARNLQIAMLCLNDALIVLIAQVML